MDSVSNIPPPPREQHFLPAWLERYPVFGLEMKLAGRRMLRILRTPFNSMLVTYSLPLAARLFRIICALLLSVLLIYCGISLYHNLPALSSSTFSTSPYIIGFSAVFAIANFFFFCYIASLGANRYTESHTLNMSRSLLLCGINSRILAYQYAISGILQLLPYIIITSFAMAILIYVDDLMYSTDVYPFQLLISIYGMYVTVYIISTYLGQLFARATYRWMAVVAIWLVYGAAETLIHLLLYQYTRSSPGLILNNATDSLIYIEALLSPIMGIGETEPVNSHFIFLFIATRILYWFLAMLIARDAFAKRLTS